MSKFFNFSNQNHTLLNREATVSLVFLNLFRTETTRTLFLSGEFISSPDLARVSVAKMFVLGFYKNAFKRRPFVQHLFLQVYGPRLRLGPLTAK